MLPNHKICVLIAHIHEMKFLDCSAYLFGEDETIASINRFNNEVQQTGDERYYGNDHPVALVIDPVELIKGKESRQTTSNLERFVKQPVAEQLHGLAIIQQR
ncbi:26S proteasome non-ATPase regulatory subunit [Dirofilaria immitis]